MKQIGGCLVKIIMAAIFILAVPMMLFPAEKQPLGRITIPDIALSDLPDIAMVGAVFLIGFLAFVAFILFVSWLFGKPGQDTGPARETALAVVGTSRHDSTNDRAYRDVMDFLRKHTRRIDRDLYDGEYVDLRLDGRMDAGWVCDAFRQRGYDVEQHGNTLRFWRGQQ